MASGLVGIFMQGVPLLKYLPSRTRHEALLLPPGKPQKESRSRSEPRAKPFEDIYIAAQHPQELTATRTATGLVQASTQLRTKLCSPRITENPLNKR